MIDTPTPYHNYRLSKGHFQNGSDAKSMVRREVHRLDIESDKQYAQRVEMAITSIEDKFKHLFDEPSFRTVIIHGKGMATITVEVIHGEKRSLPSDGLDQGNESPADHTDNSEGD